jgi:hypothetical protein
MRPLDVLPPPLSYSDPWTTTIVVAVLLVGMIAVLVMRTRRRR